MTRVILTASIILGVLVTVGLSVDPAYAAVFAKYDGIDGESKDTNHDKWIDVLNVDWGFATVDGKKDLSVQELVLEMEYEKSSPKLQEKALMGEVIPKLEIETTADYGGSRAVYLKYELKNVQITSYSVNIPGDEIPPTVVIGNNFEELKVTYTEFDDTGSSQGTVETHHHFGKRSR